MSREDRRPKGRPRAGSWRTGSFVLVFALSAAVTCASSARVGPDTLAALVPEDGAVPGWSRDGDLQEYVGEDLYTYIDGGAEIYQEYGFRRVVLQDYKNAAGKSVSLEIFEMETPAAAYGIFTFKRSGEGMNVRLGLGAELEDYYLNFWKGRYLVTLTGFDETSETIAGLQAVGGKVDQKIREGGSDIPQLVAALPGDGLRAGTVKYLKGILGLNNIYPFYTARGLNFVAAVKGDYGEGTFLMVMDYGSAESGSKAWAELGAYLESSDKFKRAATAQGGRSLFGDGKGGYAAFVQSGPRLFVGVGPTAEAALGLAQRALR